MYVLSNGRSYIGKGPGNTLQSVPDLRRAALWKNEVAVRNVIQTLPKQLKASGYVPTYLPDVEDQKTEVAPSLQPQHQVRRHMAPAEDVQKVIGKIQEFQELVSGANQRHTQYMLDLNAVEREIIDIEHKIEFDNLNAAQGYRMYSLLRDARKRRRECKDMIALLESVINSTRQDWLDGKPGHLANSMLDRSYIPRELPELFE